MPRAAGDGDRSPDGPAPAHPGGARAIAELDAADLPARLAFRPGPEADRQRRYVFAHDRHLIRTIDEFLKVRTKANDGEFDQADLRADVAPAPVPPLPAGERVAEGRVRGNAVKQFMLLVGLARGCALFPSARPWP